MRDRSLQIYKGTLDVLILRTVSGGPLHGYGIAKAILDASGEVFDVEEGALYPALRRLEQKGLLSGRWGRTESGREARFYRLTAPGRAESSPEARSQCRRARRSPSSVPG